MSHFPVCGAILESMSQTYYSAATILTRMAGPDTVVLKSVREQVEALLPNWESWYPSLFHAAEDLGVIRARVCSPSSLMLSNRHASVQSAAVEAFREKWGGKE